jgi:hemerythrin-like domain-containing protein
MDVFTQLSDEHATLSPIIEAIQAAAEEGNRETLLAQMAAHRAALASDLDAHITLEEEGVFSLAEQAVGPGIVGTFRAEHTEIQTLRDELFAQAEQAAVSFSLCLQFCDLIRTHMLREDEMLFPSAKG